VGGDGSSDAYGEQEASLYFPCR